MRGAFFAPTEPRSFSHIFDGETIRRNIGNFQMQDLTDDLLSNLIHDERYWRTSCHVRRSLLSRHI